MSAIVPQSGEKREMPELSKQMTVEYYSLMTKFFFPQGIRLRHFQNAECVVCSNGLKIPTLTSEDIGA